MAAADSLIKAILDTRDPSTEGVLVLDAQIALLCERARSTHPRFAHLAAAYRDEVDLLLEVRYWLTGPPAAG